MRAILFDGTEIDCGNFKALDSGVVLTSDRKRKKVIGFVPMAELKYVVPDDFAADSGDEDEEIAETVDADEDEEIAETVDADETVVTDEYVELGGDDDSNADTDDPVESSDTEEADDAVESTAVRIDDSARETAGSTAEERQPTSEDEYVELGLDDESDAPGDADADSGETDLRRLGSLGEASAERLRSAGFATLADLAVADPDAVASSADVPPGRARRWVTAARTRVGDGTTTSGEADDEMDSDEEPASNDDGAPEVRADDAVGDDEALAPEGDGDTTEDDDRAVTDEDTTGPTGENDV